VATPSSEDRVARRRALVVAEVLEHAVDVMTESGVGALSVNEVARRTGMRGPSLYKYFPSLHALYDALFARAAFELQEALATATRDTAPGVERLRAGARACLRWGVEHPALAQLLFWRPVPGFEPSERSFAPMVEDMRLVRVEFSFAVAAGQLSPAADSDDAVRLWTVVLGGLLSQQMANDPGATFADGVFTRLTDQALDLFFTRYAPTGGPHADPRP
jgi:AcrR family transcriptional regulator